jgi:hypothetical protein
MIERLAITAVGIAATVVLTVGLVAAGFAPRQGEADASAALIDEAMLAAAQASAEATEDPTFEPEVVYVKPAPARETVVVQRQASVQGSSSGRSADARPVRSVRSSGSDDRSEREDREDRDDHEDREDREGDDD